MKKKDIQKEMGMISNLIMDMTLADCSTDELIRATKHSMTVIDAYKHKYDYKLSEEENRIAELKEKYQGKHIGLDGKEHGGAATIITRAKSPERVEKTQGTPSIDPTTGEKVYKLSIDRFHPVNDYDKPTGMMTIRTVDGKKIVYNTKDPAEVERYAPVKTVEDEKGKMHFGPDITNKAGDIHYRVGVTTEETHSMDRVRDAMQLVRDPSNEKELEYARYANSMKSLANKARLDALSVEENPRNNEAYQEYNIEVQSLRAKLNEAELNAPRERAAQRIAQGEIKIAIENNPALSDDKKMLKKISDKALQRAREATGAARHTINIEDREWEAIQKNAISKTELNKILKYADGTRVRELAMPRSNNGISPSKQARIKSYVAQGREIAEIANILGVSQSTVAKYMSSKS
ncbi:MAG: hypothetical protein KBS79_00900 [Lachnospiraceae bacterium]|nr:hypothetical protein [Candidatus Minthocola equi]